MDANGLPVVDTHNVPHRDTYFNHTEGAVGTKLGSTTTLATDPTGGVVTLDVSMLNPGQAVRVVFRLVNNDGDTGTIVRIKGASTTTPPTVTADPAAAAEGRVLARRGPSSIPTRPPPRPTRSRSIGATAPGRRRP